MVGQQGTKEKNLDDLNITGHNETPREPGGERNYYQFKELV